MTASQGIVVAIAVFLLMMLGAVLQSRLRVLATLLIASAMLATATATLGLREWHYLFKPLTMVLAVLLVLRRDDGRPTPWLLVAALVASLAGDICLMLPANLFIPGLAAFLLAQLCYIALFHQQLAWFPSRVALIMVLAVGVAMLVILWGGLGDPALKAAVSAYVLVISLMAAQAIGRATMLQDRSSTLVAVGACFFMLSDSLIAINRFVIPLPLSSLWVLSTYYLAQILIVLHATHPTLSLPRRKPRSPPHQFHRALPVDRAHRNTHCSRAQWFMAGITRRAINSARTSWHNTQQEGHAMAHQTPLDPTATLATTRRRISMRVGAATLLLAALLAGCAVELENTRASQEVARMAEPPGSVYLGWRVFQNKCAGCHGPSATGSDKGPNLLARVRDMGSRQFVSVVLQRYDLNQAATQARGDGAAFDALIDQIVRRQEYPMAMPTMDGEPSVNAHLTDLYAYLSARATNTQGPGRPTP